MRAGASCGLPFRQSGRVGRSTLRARHRHGNRAALSHAWTGDAPAACVTAHNIRQPGPTDTRQATTSCPTARMQDLVPGRAPSTSTGGSDTQRYRRFRGGVRASEAAAVSVQPLRDPCNSKLSAPMTMRRRWASRSTQAEGSVVDGDLGLHGEPLDRADRQAGAIVSPRLPSPMTHSQRWLRMRLSE